MEETTVIDRPLNVIFDPEVLSTSVGSLDVRGVHLWVVNSVGCQDRMNDSECWLSEDEQKRAQQFRSGRDRNLFVTGRRVTRLLLAHYTGSRPEKVTIKPNAFGKPLTDARLHFNISHSHDQLLLGFSDSAIGVDIEKKDPSIEIERFGERHFSEAEYQMMMTDDKAGRGDRFFDIWTKKESLVKGIGEGLHIPFQVFNVAGRDGLVQWDIPTGHTYGDWYVRGIEAKQGYASAYATRNTTVNLRYFRVDH